MNASMTATQAEDLVRPLLWIGFDGKIPSPETMKLVHVGVSGVILFARNVVAASKLQRSDACWDA